VSPLSPERFALELTMRQSMHDKLRYAQALLGHQVPSGDIAQVFELGLDELIDKLERRKFAATSRPRRRPRHPSANPRHIPAEVKRTVWERDGGQCTYLSEAGQRCPARSRLEYDHIDPVARGGRATAERMRLRCRAHNQYAAECVFGADFMRRKREEARAAATAKAEAAAAAQARKQATEEVIPWLRALGIRGDQARRAAALCESVPDASLEQRVRLALSCFGKTPERRAAGSCR
jgi:5-methylcytosine-specific restriction endonuclease McrA